VVGGAWPFLVGGAICLVYSDNERDAPLLNTPRIISFAGVLRGIGGIEPHESAQ
jgi:hypothetical protein